MVMTISSSADEAGDSCPQCGLGMAAHELQPDPGGGMVLVCLGAADRTVD